MTARNELERRLADYYASEAPVRAPDRVLASVLDRTESTRQRARPNPCAVEVPNHHQLCQGSDRDRPGLLESIVRVMDARARGD
jgi:hypothetical protein